MDRRDQEAMPPRETVNDWLRFVAERRFLHEVTDWLTLRAAEIAWEFEDLSMALVLGVKKPHLVGFEPDEPILQ